MRLDDFVSTVGLIKRRTLAKEMAEGGLVKLNGNRCKPAHQVKAGDIISISGASPVMAEVLAIPSGSVRKISRQDFFRILN